MKQLSVNKLLALVLLGFIMLGVVLGFPPPPPIEPNPTPVPDTTITASITSTDTPTPGTDTTVTASVTSEAETGTPTTVTETVSHAPETSTPVTNTTHVPTFTGICLTDVVNVGFLRENIEHKFYNFPKFNDWCSNNILYSFSGRNAGSKMEIKINQEDVKSIFIMTSVSSKKNPPYDYDPIKGGPVAKITYTYKNGTIGTMDLIPGRHVAHWNYQVESSGFVRAMPDFTYPVWNGLDDRKINAAQILITMLDPAKINGQIINLEQNPLISIEIEAIDHPDLYLDMYGLMVSDQTTDEIRSSTPQLHNFEPICLNRLSDDDEQDENHRLHINNSRQITRSINYSTLILKDNDYHRDVLGTCEPVIPSLVLPDNLIRPTSDNHFIPRIPIIINKTIYETRPPSNSFEISGEPELDLLFNQLDSSRTIKRIHFLLSVRNACNPDSGINTRIGMIKLKYQDQEYDPIYLELGQNVRQGRSGIEKCDIGGVDRRITPNSNLFLYSIPLVAQKTEDTGGQSVALWADVISIPVEGIPANTPFEVVITDLTKPKRNVSADPDSRDTVEYSDTYLVLYGVTLEYAE